MEIFIKNHGLQNISEDIFKLLDKKTLTDCRLVNSSWKKILDQPIFWLKKINSENIPEDVERNWKMLALKLNQANDDIAKKFVLILIKIYKRKKIICPLEVVAVLSRWSPDDALPVKITYLENLEDPHETASMKTGA